MLSWGRSQFCELNGNPAAGLAIYQLPGANAIAVADSVRAKMEELSKNFPEGMKYEIPLDTTTFTKASINEVYRTLMEAAVLVLMVILAFLQKVRTVLIPTTTMPVTIIGAFIAMVGLGFSINMVTLFALVLAIGIVVDDAIVIVEGASHGIEKGMSPKDATIKAMNELIGPVMGITFVLMAVFIPAAFIPSITGSLYNQFALVIAATAAISALNAVTLKPVQCATYLRPHSGEKLNAFYRGFNYVYQIFENWYIGLISWALKRLKSMMIVFIALLVLTFWAFMKTPTGFLPDKDQGYAIVAVQLPDGSALAKTEKLVKKVDSIIRSVPGVKDNITIGGVSVLDNSTPHPNASINYVIYKDFDERIKNRQSQEFIIAEPRKRLSLVEEALIVPLIPPAIQGLGVASCFQMQLESRAGFDYGAIAAALREIATQAQKDPRIGGATSTFRPGMPAVTADVDRVKAQSDPPPIYRTVIME
ncbi:MAG: efflux RND transporter permease subunit [Deltaproteobacteria bacterium]|nr:efflux RND transporter permease subunit [Deltaproteobacteria bacterium]